jgi:hypothetical protein
MLVHKLVTCSAAWITLTVSALNITHVHLFFMHVYSFLQYSVTDCYVFTILHVTVIVIWHNTILVDVCDFKMWVTFALILHCYLSLCWRWMCARSHCFNDVTIYVNNWRVQYTVIGLTEANSLNTRCTSKLTMDTDTK